MFTQSQSQGVTGKLEFVRLFYCKVVLGVPNVCAGRFVIERTSKKTCKYGEYGAFSDLLFLFFCQILFCHPSGDWPLSFLSKVNVCDCW